MHSGGKNLDAFAFKKMSVSKKGDYNKNTSCLNTSKNLYVNFQNTRTKRERKMSKIYFMISISQARK